MPTYVRFQTSVRCGRTQRPLGVFQAAGDLEDRQEIDPCFLSAVWDSLYWFNRNLKVPRLAAEHHRSLFWFRSESQTVIQHLWALVAILREHEIQVRKICTTDPGMIVYRDLHQIAAVPNRQITYALRA